MTKTQGEMIIEYIKRNGSITKMEAMRDLYITKCDTRISELRRAGYNITDRWEKSERPNTKPYKRYFLEE